MANVTSSDTLARAKVTVLYQFPKETYVENLAIRPNGHILVVLLTAPELWSIDPSTTPAKATLMHSFPESTRCTGLIETRPDVFALIAGKPILNLAGGTWAIWEADFSGGKPRPAMRQIVEKVHGGGLLNGLTLLNPSTVLASDTAKGLVYSIDLKTGANQVAIKSTVHKSLAGFSIGLNGVRVRGSTLFYTNTARAGVFRIPIDKSSGAPAGSVDVFGASAGPGFDDFALSAAGDAAYACSQLLHSLIRVDLMKKDKTETVAGAKNSGLLLGPTSAVFGRTPGRENTIFMTTAGQSLIPQAVPPPDTGPGGGKVVAVEL
jgi:hypothetical protein